MTGLVKAFYWVSIDYGYMINTISCYFFVNPLDCYVLLLLNKWNTFFIWFNSLLHIQIYGLPGGMHFSKACMIHSMQLKLEGNMCVLFLFVCSYKRFRIAAMHSYSLSSKRTRTYRISHWRFFRGWYHSTPHQNPLYLWFRDDLKRFTTTTS